MAFWIFRNMLLRQVQKYQGGTGIIDIRDCFYDVCSDIVNRELNVYSMYILFCLSSSIFYHLISFAAENKLLTIHLMLLDLKIVDFTFFSSFNLFSDMKHS